MKRLAAALAALVLAAPLNAAPKDKVEISGRTLTILSDARVEAKPDLARILLHFTAYGWTVDKSRAKVDQVVKKFLDRLEREKVPFSDIQMGDVRLKPSYQFNRDIQANVQSNFLVSRPLTLSLQDLKAIEKVLDLTIETGSFLLESARLTVQDPDALERGAFNQALAEGRKKAEALAKPLGVEIGDVVAVEELDYRMEDIDLIQDTDFSMKASGQAKRADSGDEKPDAASSQSPELSPASHSSVRAVSRLRVTYALK